MKVNRKFKVLSKYGLIKRNMAYVLIGYMKENAIINTGKSLKMLLNYEYQGTTEEVREKITKFRDSLDPNINTSLTTFMASQVHRVVVKRETDAAMDGLLFFIIKKYMGKKYVNARFTQRLFDRLESGKYPLHPRLIKAKNYHSNGKGV